ncbi:MAG: succinylglutamate desuccinylase/aspartoacylase family protein [Chloroflexota bacterium]|nr:succinylglutamate desuccinylase/aspartoacylase family protein [Chloroflexota bacterium]
MSDTTGSITGSTSLRWIEVATLSTGLPLHIAVHEITGASPGPRVGITASVHGDELAPVEAVRRLVVSIDPAELRGTLRIAPVVNPLAFQSQTRHTPQDMQNLNRVFPGDPDGWLTEQLAAAFVRDFLPGLDALLDLHAGGALPTVDYAYIDNDEALSAAFGTKILYRGPGYPGTLSAVAVERGIRTVVTELGGGLVRDAAYIEQTESGLRNALRHLGALPKEPSRRDDQIIVDHITIIRPHHGGLLVPGVGADQLGSTVPKGTVLGTIYNPQTFETLETITAPFDPTLMILTRGAVTRVEAGDYGWMVAEG